MGMAMTDIPPHHRDFVGVRVIADNCRKHVRALCFTARGMEALCAMQPVFDGNWLSIGFTAHGPLRWTHLALDIFLRSSGRGIPTTINGEPMAGVTGPVTLAGSIAVGNAEILAGIVVNQILEPGRPMIYNLGLAHTFDMRYATAVTGGPENALFAVASAAMGRYYDLPSCSWVSTDSLLDDSQAAMEKMFGFQVHASSGVSLIWGMGQLESEKKISLIQLVLDNELINYCSRFQRGIDFTPDSLQIPLIEKIGPSGSFLETDHTFGNFRTEFWEPVLLNRQGHRLDGMEIERRAAERARDLLRRDPLSHHDQDRLDELRSIERRFCLASNGT
jgi:trimethylamine:corrinoid methyltransferase-like protein